MFKTTARVLLAKHLRSTKTTQTALADRLGINQASISAWVLGKSRPEWHQRLALFCIADIDPMAWLTPAELRLIERLGARITISVERVAA